MNLFLQILIPDLRPSLQWLLPGNMDQSMKMNVCLSLLNSFTYWIVPLTQLDATWALTGLPVVHVTQK